MPLERPLYQSITDDDAPIWGAAAIAKEANVTLRAAYHGLIAGHLPATKVGAKWCTTRRRLRSIFAGKVLGVER